MIKYLMCPKCELKSYWDPDKQDVCNQCLGAVETKSKVTHHKALTSTPTIKDPIRYKGRAVYFVFQNKEFRDEFASGVIKAPYYDKGGFTPHHWLRLTNVKKGDVILHGVTECVLAISEAKGPCYDFYYRDGRQGRMVDCEYHVLENPLVTDRYREEIIEYCSQYKYQPFNKNGDGNEGYLFDICHEVAKRFISDIVARNPSLATCVFINDILS